jgi:hypothetical protein
MTSSCRETGNLEYVTIIDSYCNPSVPLMNLSGNGQIADLDSGTGLFAAWPVPFCGKFKAVGKKEEGNAAVSDNPLLERVAAVGEDCHLTSEFAFGQIVLRMNGQKPPFCP